MLHKSREAQYYDDPLRNPSENLLFFLYIYLQNLKFSNKIRMQGKIIRSLNVDIFLVVSWYIS